MSFPVFDLHCDTALALLGKDLTQSGSLLKNACHIDLNRAKMLPGYAQCFACFTTPEMQQWYHKSPVEIFELELASILREIEKNQDIIGLCYSAAQIENNRKNGKMSAVLTIEGPAGFDYDAALLEDIYKIGFRITTLGWNEGSPLAGSHITGQGLTQQGREYVKQAQGLGMLIDVSHISDQAFWDIMDITQAPVIASHSNSRRICSVSRNLTDEMFRTICQTGGVAGLNLYCEFVGGEKNIDSAVSHILHFLELDPTGEHIALGGDLDGCDTLVSGINGIDDYPALGRKLKELGVEDKIIADIFWNNALGVMANAVCNNQK